MAVRILFRVRGTNHRRREVDRLPGGLVGRHRRPPAMRDPLRHRARVRAPRYSPLRRLPNQERAREEKDFDLALDAATTMMYFES